MKTKKTIFKSFSLALIMLFSTSVFAQFEQLGSVLSTGTDDANKILEAYISPYANGMGAGLSGGWYNTAKPHKLGGFDITITANVSIIPSSDKSFDPNKLNLGNASEGVFTEITGNESPTAAGKNSPGPEVIYTKDVMNTPADYSDDVEFARFNLPKGSNFNYTLMPMIQAGIGLVKETEIIARYSPKITYGKGGKVGLWGIGLKHGVKQWIPGLKKLPLFQMTLHGGYTKFSSTNPVDFQPSFYDNVSGITIIPPLDDNYYKNQEMIMDISNTSINLLVGADLKIVSVYGAIGYSMTNTNLRLEGNYPVPYFEGTSIRISDENLENTDPIDLTIKSNDLRLNAGVRIKMAVVSLHFDYTYANYSIATAGLGISFR